MHALWVSPSKLHPVHSGNAAFHAKILKQLKKGEVESP